jgi:dihydrofolate reductase
VSGIVQIQTSMSLDGFIAGPGDDMDWVFENVAAGEDAAELMVATGAILAGRRTYEVGRRSSRQETSEPYGGGWSGVQFVLSHRPPDEEDPSVTFLSGDIAGAVQTARAAAGDKNLAIFGGHLGAQCLAAGLVDEIAVFVLPVLLGDGVPLFRPDVPLRVRLRQVASRAGPGHTALRYRVER